MDNLTILDLYNNAESKKINNFTNNIDSNVSVKLDYSKVDCDYEWVEKFEETIPHLDSILRNPNRFIVNEEDVVKIELARRITSESIKHLSRNTNLIQDIDKKTGDVKPSKILNINKEESFNTYENRFIYSLIKNMQFFIERKKSETVKSSSLKDDKVINYNATSKVGKEKIDVSLSLHSNYNDVNGRESGGSSGNDMASRIETIQLKISDLTNQDVFKSIAKLHISLVTSPIKKTNMILKNVNFQYAVNLWNYIQQHTDSSVSEIKNKKEYTETGDIKRYLNESVMLDYLVLNSLSPEEGKEKVSKEEVSERIVANMVEKMLDVNESLSEEQLKNIVSKQYAVIKYKAVVNDSLIQKRFKKYIGDYIKRINEVKL